MDFRQVRFIYRNYLVQQNLLGLDIQLAVSTSEFCHANLRKSLYLRAFWAHLDRHDKDGIPASDPWTSCNDFLAFLVVQSHSQVNKMLISTALS